MATRGKKKPAAKKKVSKKKGAKKKVTKKKATKKKATSKRSSKKNSVAPIQVSKSLPPKAAGAVKKAAEALWGQGVPPHDLIQEVHEALLLRCLDEAEGNYAAAAALFGPSRQSVQQYANSTLRDERWKPYQQNRRKRRS